MDDKKRDKELEAAKDAIMVAVEVLHDRLCPHHPDAAGASRGRPAQVATPQYRTNFEGIFGRRPDVGEA